MLGCSMPLKMNSTMALVVSAFMELHTNTHHLFWMICRMWGHGLAGDGGVGVGVGKFLLARVHDHGKNT